MKNIFITGASRGVGLEIAKVFAKDGANIAFVSKTTEVHPKLEGTIYTARDELLSLGANDVTAIKCNVMELDELQKAITTVGEKYGHLDLLVNNASSIYLLNTESVSEKQYSLMHGIIVQSSLFATKYALPFLEKSDNPHILQIAPKPDLKAKWFSKHTAYTLCKFSASMMVIGHASEFAKHGIAVNALWPATLLNTAAVKNLLGGDVAIARSRYPSIMADAAFHITQLDSKLYTGDFYLDEAVIKSIGGDLDKYSVVSGASLITDLYVGDNYE